MTDRRLTAALAGSATVATNAPALRHSRPWRWVLRTASLDLYSDPQTQLSREETLMTCGGAVHRARVALVADGFGVRVDLLPDGDPEHVATLTPTDLSAQTSDRPTTAPHGPAADPVKVLERVASAEGTRLRPLDPAEAARLAAATPVLAQSARAGVERDQLSLFAILYGDRSAPRDWVRAGQALSAVDLNATEVGLAVVASAAAVATARSRDVLRGVLPPGTTPYLALRISPAPGH